MKRKLIAFAGAAIIASASPLLAGAPAASAATVPDVPSFVITPQLGSCTYSVTIYEDRDSNGAFVVAHLDSDPCEIGTEGAIFSPDLSIASFGGDVHFGGEDSDTGHIPANSGNHHGIRFWYNNTWNYAFAD